MVVDDEGEGVRYHSFGQDTRSVCRVPSLLNDGCMRLVGVGYLRTQAVVGD